MLKIRETQMQSLSTKSLADFVDRIRNHIRSELPEDSKHLSDQDLNILIQRCFSEANEYGLESELDVCLFTDITIMLGVDFLRDSRYRSIRTLLEADFEPEVDLTYDLEADAETGADVETEPEDSPSTRIEQAFDMAIEFTEHEGGEIRELL